jgi:hypothetical protein
VTTKVYADGQAWVDADGQNEWPTADANALASLLETQGYTNVTLAQPTPGSAAEWMYSPAAAALN